MGRDLSPRDSMSDRHIKRLLTKNNNRQLLLLASLGLLLLLVGTFTLPFNQGLFSHLFTKPASHADTMMMGPQHIGCTFLSDPTAKPAFCETFQTPAPGGRGGDLDESHWDFSRVTGQNGNQQFNWAPPTTAQFCKDQIIGILPFHDSFFCGTQFNEAEHWMETFNDYGGFAYNDAMIRQPFDFTNRTGTITFEVDNKTAGGHMWWTDLWITDQPMPAPQLNQVHSIPHNGVDITFADDCGTYPNATKASVSNIQIVNNDNLTSYLTNYNGFTKFDCYTTHDDMANHFEIKVSQSDIQIWATDDDQTNFREIVDAPNLNLGFSTGYVHFEHTDYNPAKYGIKDQQTYHWHNIGFDGPILPLQRGYSIPDALVPNGNQGVLGVNLGYIIPPNAGVITCCDNQGRRFTVPPFSIPSVDLSNATGAFISMDAQYQDTATVIKYRLNNGTWHDFSYTLPPLFQWNGQQGIVIPVAVSELIQGTNTIEFSQTNPSNSDLPVENIDLVVQTSQVPSAPPATYMFTPQASVPPFPTPQFNVSASVTPLSLDQNQIATVSAQVTNTTSSPINGQLIFGILQPNGEMDYYELYNNSRNMTFQPGQTINHSFSFTVPTTNEPNNTFAFLGTYKVIISILSPDQSSILYTNNDLANFSVPLGTTPEPSSSPTPNPSMSPMPNMLTVSTSALPSTLAPSQTVSLTTTLTNTTSSTLTGGITLSIMDPTGAQVFSQLIDNTNAMSLMPNMPMTHTISYTLPSNAALGTYTVSEQVVSQDGVISYYSNPSVASFSVNSAVTTPSPSPTLVGDFNGDGHVNLVDLSIFASSYGTSSPNIPNPQCDLNSDGKVTLTDLSLFASNYGK